MRARHLLATSLTIAAGLPASGRARAEAASSARGERIAPVTKYATAPELRCPTANLLGEALRGQLANATEVRFGEPRRGETGIFLSPGPQGQVAVWIWEEGSAVPRVRALGGTGESCRDLAEAVALLASTFLRLGALEVAAIPDASPPASTSSGPPSVGPLSAGMVPPTSSAAAVAAPAAASWPAPPGPHRWRLSVAASWLGGVQGAGLGGGDGLASVGVELTASELFGIGGGAEVTWGSDQSDPQVAGARLDVRRQFGGAWLIFHPLPRALPGWAWKAGPLLEHVAGSGHGYPQAVTQEFFALGGALASRYELGLGGPLAAFAEVGLRALPQSLYFYALSGDGSERRLYTEPQLSFSAGVGLALLLGH